MFVCLFLNVMFLLVQFRFCFQLQFLFLMPWFSVTVLVSYTSFLFDHPWNWRSVSMHPTSCAGAKLWSGQWKWSALWRILITQKHSITSQLAMNSWETGCRRTLCSVTLQIVCSLNMFNSLLLVRLFCSLSFPLNHFLQLFTFPVSFHLVYYIFPNSFLFPLILSS